MNVAIPPAVVGTAAAVAVVSPFNLDTVIIAVIAAIPATIASIAAYRQAKATHLSVNSRMTELLELAKKEASAQATLDEKTAQRAREGDAAIDRAAIAAPTGERP